MWTICLKIKENPSEIEMVTWGRGALPPPPPMPFPNQKQHRSSYLVYCGHHTELLDLIRLFCFQRIQPQILVILATGNETEWAQSHEKMEYCSSLESPTGHLQLATLFLEISGCKGSQLLQHPIENGSGSSGGQSASSSSINCTNSAAQEVVLTVYIDYKVWLQI